MYATHKYHAAGAGAKAVGYNAAALHRAANAKAGLANRARIVLPVAGATANASFVFEAVVHLNIKGGAVGHAATRGNGNGVAAHRVGGFHLAGVAFGAYKIAQVLAAS